MGTDYIDLFFVHSFGDNGVDASLELLKSQELKVAAEAAKKSGKLKLFGLSTHHKDRAVILQAAAEVGFIDAIMVQYSPWLDKQSALNKALDACHERGIGLISMKQIAGRLRGGETLKGILDDVERRVPTLAERKLTPFQGFLHAIWSDERISAACVAMQNTDQVRENADAARRFEPLKTADIERLRDAVIADRPDFLRRLRRPLCPCRGHAGRAGRSDAVLDLPRASRRPGGGAAALRGTIPRGTRLVGRRPGRGPCRVPEPSRFRDIAAGSRETPGLTSGLPSQSMRERGEGES